MKLPVIAFLTLLINAVSALGYIPPTDYILSRTAENTPRGNMTVEYAVQFENGAHQYATKETWIFGDNGQMKLKVNQGFQLDIAYSPSERVFQDKQGRKTQRLSLEFIEKLHFIKSADAYIKIMGEHGISREKIQNPLLSRGAGVVNYGFFERAQFADDQTPGGNLFPGMWLEQDQFLFRQMRFRSQALFQIEEYQQIGKSFFPKLKTLQWGKNKVQIKTILATEKKTIKPNDFSVATSLDLSMVPAEIKSTVLEFYSRFR
jgi:hypothetical protein